MVLHGRRSAQVAGPPAKHSPRPCSQRRAGPRQRGLPTNAWPSRKTPRRALLAARGGLGAGPGRERNPARQCSSCPQFVVFGLCAGQPPPLASRKLRATAVEAKRASVGVRTATLLAGWAHGASRGANSAMVRTWRARKSSPLRARVQATSCGRSALGGCFCIEIGRWPGRGAQVI